MNDLKKVIAIVGPTASGKTRIAVGLAKKFNGEIVSADSRQIFRGLDLGTGKDLSEYDGVKYHLIDICDPGEEFNLFKYTELATKAIEDILKRGKLPIIVGGTGLYIQALIEGFALEKSETRNPKSETNSKYKIINPKTYPREQLNNLSVEELQAILEETDPRAFEMLADKKNPHRLIRAIEKAQTGETVTKKKPDWEVLQIGITRSREELNKRIDKRVDDRFEEGMLSEAEGLLKSGVSPDWMLKLGLEYRMMTSFLISNDKFLISNQVPKPNVQFQKYDSLEQMVSDLKLKSHQYAKRQMTWFRRFPEIVWENDPDQIEKIVKDFIKK